MEYLNERLVLLSKVAHTRGQIEQAEHGESTAQGYLLALLDQQEAALNEYDERIKATEQHE